MNRWVDLITGPEPPLEIPADLIGMVNQLEHLQRFMHPEYPPGVIRDNVKIHTLRCIATAQQVGGIDQSKLERMLWIHDIPELIVTDVTAVQKDEDPEMAALLEKREEEAAAELLSAKDLLLLTEYNQASDYMKGKNTNQIGLSPEALIAKVIDGLDGNIVFHHYIAKWAASPDYDPKFLPPERAFMHTFKGIGTYRRQLDSITAFPTDTARQLVDETVKAVQEAWQAVDQEKMPKPVIDHIIPLS